MFVDQITIYAKAGNGGDGVVRWSHEKFKPKAGPSGGNGGRGGDIFMRAVRDVNLLAKYTGEKKFEAESGEDGMNKSLYGKNGEDLTIDIPVGSVVYDKERERTYYFNEEGQIEKIFKGGGGGLGNKVFKTSTNRSPEQATLGRVGEEGELEITLSLVVDVGLIGMPNAGKSSLLNIFTNAKSKTGDYPFTTTVPHLGDFYGYIVADIPGLIEGAAEGRGLGHTFLRHVSHTKMLLHLVSLDEDNVFERYQTIREELSRYDTTLTSKEEWVILTKKDLINKDKIEVIQKEFDNNEIRVFVISINDDISIKNLKDALIEYLRRESA